MEPTQTGATEEEAAAGILSLIEEPDKTPPQEESLAKKPPQEEEAEATEEEAQPEAEAEETVEIDLDAPLWEVKVQGETKKISTNEALKGFMMESDYRQKTAEVARQREELNETIRQGTEGERKKYLDGLQMAQAMVYHLLVPEMQNRSLDQLVEDDPHEAIKVQNRFAKIQQVQNYLGQKFMEERQQRFAKAAADVQKIPNWGPELQRQVAETGVSLGFTTEELAELDDARYIKGLHELRTLRDKVKAYEEQAEKSKQVAAKKVVEKPKVLKPGSKQPAQSGDDLQRLKKTGKIEDAAQAIFNRL